MGKVAKAIALVVLGFILGSASTAWAIGGLRWVNDSGTTLGTASNPVVVSLE